jgi:hypothetical protein
MERVPRPAGAVTARDAVQQTEIPMKRYRKVTSRLWDDPRISRLSDAALVLYLYMFTHPQQTALGAFRGTCAGLAEERRWTPAKLRKALEELLRAGLIVVDQNASYFGVPEFFVDNRPESPNVVKSWVSAAEYVPDCSAKSEQLRRARRICVELGLPYVEAFDQGFPEASGKALQEVSGKAFQEAFGKAFQEGSREASTNKELEKELEPEREQERELDSECQHVDVLEADDGFEEFWSVYPRKEKKREALDVWRKLRPSPTLVEKIVRTVSAFKKTADWLRDRGQYIPQPANWLKAARWEDEPTGIPFLSSNSIGLIADSEHFAAHPLGDGPLLAPPDLPAQEPAPPMRTVRTAPSLSPSTTQSFLSDASQPERWFQQAKQALRDGRRDKATASDRTASADDT